MESTLHRQLKERYGPEAGGRAEVAVDGFRIDAIDPDGTLIEIQAAPLGALKAKLRKLLDAHQVRVIKPVPIIRRIVRRDRKNGPDLSSRRSPNRGELLDVFDDLIGLARIFPHPNLTVEVVGVEIEEVRLARRRRGHRVIDRRLVAILSTTVLRTADDLWSLLPVGLDGGPFTTLDCAHTLGRSIAFAQRVAYCLRHSGAVSEGGVLERRRVYSRSVVEVSD
jgi:hypothetical protein